MVDNDSKLVFVSSDCNCISLNINESSEQHYKALDELVSSIVFRLRSNNNVVIYVSNEVLPF